MNSSRDLERYTTQELGLAYHQRLQISEIPTHKLEEELLRREKQFDSVYRGVPFIGNKGFADRVREFLVFTAKHFSVSVEDLIAKERNQRLSDARHVGIVVAMKVYRISQAEVSKLFNRTSHSSAIHARNAVARRPELLEEARVLEAKWINYNKNK